MMATHKDPSQMSFDYLIFPYFFKQEDTVIAHLNA